MLKMGLVCGALLAGWAGAQGPPPASLPPASKANVEFALEAQGGLTVGVVHEFVGGATDGWKHVLAALERSRSPDATLLGEVRGAQHRHSLNLSAIQ